MYFVIQLLTYVIGCWLELLCIAQTNAFESKPALSSLRHMDSDVFCSTFHDPAMLKDLPLSCSQLF